MIDVETFEAFSKHASLATTFATGAERLGRSMATTAGTAGKDLLHSVSPKHLPKALRQGAMEMTNMSAAKRQALTSKLVGKSDYVADFHHAPGIGAKLRRAGILGNAPKYVGKSKTKKALNMARRALPGEMGITAPLMAQGAYSTATEKADPRTGKRPGVAERGLRTGLGITTGVVGMRSGKMLPAMMSGMVGDFVGKHVGRGIDRTVLRKKPAQVGSGGAA